MTLQTLLVRYSAFAVFATLTNLATQRAVLHFGESAWLYVLAVGAGTIVGLGVKYVLDKHWIFFDRERGLHSHGKKFTKYAAMGLVTTAIFWGSETAFFLIWHTDLMRESRRDPRPDHRLHGQVQPRPALRLRLGQGGDRAVKLSGWGRYPVIEDRGSRPAGRGGAARSGDFARRGDRAGQRPGLWRQRGQPRARRSTCAHFDRMIAFDPATGQLMAEAGVVLGDIIAAFLPRGWFPLVTPGTKFVTLGGMIAADVHGKNHHKRRPFPRMRRVDRRDGPRRRGRGAVRATENVETCSTGRSAAWG